MDKKCLGALILVLALITEARGDREIFPRSKPQFYVIEYSDGGKKVPVTVEIDEKSQIGYVRNLGSNGNSAVITFYDFRQGFVAFKDVKSSQCFVGTINNHTLSEDQINLKHFQNRSILSSSAFPVLLITRRISPTELKLALGVRISSFCSGFSSYLIEEEKPRPLRRSRRNTPEPVTNEDSGKFTHHAYGHYGHQSTNYAHYGHDSYVSGQLGKRGFQQQRVHQYQVRSGGPNEQASNLNKSNRKIITSQASSGHWPQKPQNNPDGIPGSVVHHQQDSLRNGRFPDGSSSFALRSEQGGGYQLNLPLGLRAGSNYGSNVNGRGHYSTDDQMPPRVWSDFRKSGGPSEYQQPSCCGPKTPEAHAPEYALRQIVPSSVPGHVVPTIPAAGQEMSIIPGQQTFPGVLPESQAFPDTSAPSLPISSLSEIDQLKPGIFDAGQSIPGISQPSAVSPTITRSGQAIPSTSQPSRAPHSVPQPGQAIPEIYQPRQTIPETSQPGQTVLETIPRRFYPAAPLGSQPISSIYHPSETDFTAPSPQQHIPAIVPPRHIVPGTIPSARFTPGRMRIDGVQELEHVSPHALQDTQRYPAVHEIPSGPFRRHQVPGTPPEQFPFEIPTQPRAFPSHSPSSFSEPSIISTDGTIPDSTILQSGQITPDKLQTDSRQTVPRPYLSVQQTPGVLQPGQFIPAIQSPGQVPPREGIFPRSYRPGEAGPRIYPDGRIAPETFTPGQRVPEAFQPAAVRTGVLQPGQSSEEQRILHQAYQHPFYSGSSFPGYTSGTPRLDQISQDESRKDGESFFVGQDTAASQTQVQTGFEGTAAEASSKGRHRGLGSQTQVQGGYTGNGSFSAQAQSGFTDGLTQSQVRGSKQGGTSSSSAQVKTIGSAQSQVQVLQPSGVSSGTAQGRFVGGSTKVQAQSGKSGGSAGAQAQSSGLSNSQVQVNVDGEPVQASDTFQGGVSASVHGGKSSGQSQAQLQGGYTSGRTYVATAQGGYDSVNIYQPGSDQPFATMPGFRFPSQEPVIQGISPTSIDEQRRSNLNIRHEEGRTPTGRIPLARQPPVTRTHPSSIPINGVSQTSRTSSFPVDRQFAFPSQETLPIQPIASVPQPSSITGPTLPGQLRSFGEQPSLQPIIGDQMRTFQPSVSAGLGDRVPTQHGSFTPEHELGRTLLTGSRQLPGQFRPTSIEQKPDSTGFGLSPSIVSTRPLSQPGYPSQLLTGIDRRLPESSLTSDVRPGYPALVPSLDNGLGRTPGIQRQPDIYLPHQESKHASMPEQPVKMPSIPRQPGVLPPSEPVGFPQTPQYPLRVPGFPPAPVGENHFPIAPDSKLFGGAPHTGAASIPAPPGVHPSQVLPAATDYHPRMRTTAQIIPDDKSEAPQISTKEQSCCQALRDLTKRCCDTRLRGQTPSQMPRCCTKKSTALQKPDYDEEFEENDGDGQCRVVKAVCYIVYKPVGRARICKPTSTSTSGC